jgi:hypothetical protein
MNKKILLVGTVSNVAKTIEKELKVVLKALSVFDSVQVFLVESDSADKTVKILEKIALKNKNFQFIALEKLKNIYPNRIARIAYCRNVYVKHIRDNNTISKWDYVAVADLDGMNFKLRKKGIQSCFETNIDWDGVMANQKRGYYDIYALRANNWIDKDCFEELQQLKKSFTRPKKLNFALIDFLIQFSHHDRLRKMSIYRHMRIIPVESNLIKVKSAFGGFAIYKTHIFFNNKYSPEFRGKKVSEHIPFHMENKTEENFYINPKMLNNYFNTYNINRYKMIRFLRSFYNFIRTRN